MRLLFATSLLPEAQAFSGYEIANRAILGALQALGHDVVALGFTNPGRGDAAPAGALNLGEVALVTAEVDSRQKLAWLGRAVRNGTTYAAAKLQLLDQRDIAARIAAAGPFDAVILNGVTLAAAFESVLTAAPFIYIAHNVEWQSAAESAAAAAGFVERVLYERETRLLRRIEERLTRRAVFVHALAQDDLSAFGLAGTRNANVLPLTVHAQAPEPVARAPKWDAGLIGTWSWTPNRIGLDWFLNEVTPHLPADFSIAIAGKLPGDVVLKHPGCVALGRVPDAAAFVREAAVLPLVSRAGTGVQLKSLEAFELGLPTVATSLSVRGIDGLPANCRIADEPRAFAAALVEAARAGASADRDGRAFHARREAMLKERLAEGLAAVAAVATPALRSLGA